MESPFNQIALRSPFFDTGVSVFTPLSLFSASEPGAWYDPSDMSTMFQDAAGTTAVTAVEQPVSLIYDKSKSLALGSEIVSNGTFDTNLTGWSNGQNMPASGTAVWSSGKLRLTRTSATVSYQQAITTVVGRWYKVTGTANFVSGTGNGALYITPSSSTLGSELAAQGTNNGQSGTFSFTFLATATTLYVHCVAGSANSTTYDFDNISVKELAGSHAYTPSTATASRPVLSARYNLLTATENASNAAWSNVQCTITTDQTTAPDGTNTADLCSDQNTSTSVIGQSINTGVTNVAYVASISLKRGNTDWVRIQNDDASANGARVWVNLATGAKGTETTFGTATLNAFTVTAETNGFYRISLSATFAGTTKRLIVNSASADNSGTRVLNGTYYIWGADLRVANDGVGIPTYQYVNTSTDYTTTGFPMYLRFDGSDDYMLTGTITPGTDKAQVFAGVRKLSDAATGMIAELSNNYLNGSFLLYNEGGATSKGYGYNSKGTVGASAEAYSGYVAPISNVLSGQSSISGDSVTIRINGVQAATSAADQGTGNYLAYPLYIGRRGGTTLPFNGRIFGLIVRFGANLTNTQITNTETWMNGKTKAY